MRKLLAQLLIALLLTPSLVCAMPVCPSGEQVSVVADRPHCAEQAGDTAPEQASAIMRLVDCMGVDLQPPPQTLQMVEQATPSDFGDFASLEFWSTLEAARAKSHVIRGSPERRSFTQPQLPVYLATQRFRL